MIDLLVLTSVDQLIFKFKKYIFTFFARKSCLNEEVNCTGTSPSVSVPCLKAIFTMVYFTAMASVNVSASKGSFTMAKFV